MDSRGCIANVATFGRYNIGQEKGHIDQVSPKLPLPKTRATMVVEESIKDRKPFKNSISRKEAILLRSFPVALMFSDLKSSHHLLLL